MFLTKLKVAATALLATAVLGAGTAAGVLNYGLCTGRSRRQSQRPVRKARPTPRHWSHRPPTRPTASDPVTACSIHATGTLPSESVRGTFLVEPSGKVALGPVYGRVEVQGLTLEAAEAVVRKHLSAWLKSTAVSVTRSVAVPGVEELDAASGSWRTTFRMLRLEVEELRKKVRD